MKVILTSGAARDLEQALSYLTSESPVVAAAFLNDLQNSLDLLHRFPQIGREFELGVRQAVTARFQYVIYYRIQHDDDIYVFGFFHGRRDPKAMRKRMSENKGDAKKE